MGRKIALSRRDATVTDGERVGNVPRTEDNRNGAAPAEFPLPQIDLGDEVVIRNESGSVGRLTCPDVDFAHGRETRIRR
jgi:hypothetical protein